MSVYWRPGPRAPGHHPECTGPECKPASRLWGRCDNCLWSGEWKHFSTYYRQHDHLEICGMCQTNHQLRLALWGDGWGLSKYS